MAQFIPSGYGPVFAPLLATDRRRPLDAGTPDGAARKLLNDLSPEAAFAPTNIVADDMAACCVSGVWLLHDFLDESHAISQGVDTPSGSFWHAIMHRREGDFSNAKYWLRRVGRHPVFDQIGERIGAAFEPFAFVDRCEVAVQGQCDSGELCLDIQQVEWELLFDHCYRAAVGD